MSTEQYVKDLKIDRKYFLQVADRKKLIDDFEGLKDGYMCLGLTLLSDIIYDMTGIFRTYEAVTNI